MVHNKPHTEETKRKMRKPRSEEGRKNMKGKCGINSFKKGYTPWNKNLTKKIDKRLSGGRKVGYKISNESRRKMRISAINYIKKNCKEFKPRIGKNEKQILDEIEKELNYKIIRQYYIKNFGYFVDGYIPELNLVIEVDEVPKNKEKDIIRETEIKQKLNCQFLRIKDY